MDNLQFSTQAPMKTWRMLSSATIIVKYSTQQLHECSSLSRLPWQSLKLYDALMAIFTVPYTALDPTLETTQKSPSFLYRPRVVSQVCLMYQCYCILITSYRCMVKDSDLEGPGVAYHHQEHSEVLVDEIPIVQLWDEWGLVGDIIVSSPFFFPIVLIWFMYL